MPSSLGARLSAASGTLVVMTDVEEVRYGAAFAGLDPVALGDSLRTVSLRLARDPVRLARAMANLWRRQALVGLDAARRALVDDPEPQPVTPSDRRFADRAWRDNAALRATAESYLAFSEWARELVAGVDLPAETARKARFATSLLLDALAPSNNPFLNPAVVKEAIDSGGRSLSRGLAQFLDDVATNGGRPRQVDTSPFTVGGNLAATPGRVVLRNRMIELLAYEPQTPEVRAEPIVCSPPWINKYYIMDLAPERSFIEYAVQHGFTVFAISYVNPDSSMAAVTMDDYLRDGLLAAIDRAGEITGAERVNIVGLCLGGTLATIALAYLAAQGEAGRVGWTTLTNTLVDFSEPGDLGVFTDEATVRSLEQKMRARGFLEASEMSGTFDWMRGNDLVWNYVVENWYMGKRPPAFDILTWNADSTRMPATMHSQYLRTCYMENRLVRPSAFSILGTPIDLSKVETPMYVLAAEADHIAPWRSAYATTQAVGGEVRFTLTNSGHIAGIVNPPGNPKAAHWSREGCPADPEAWLATAERQTGSWWEHWVRWAEARSGPLVDPPTLPEGDTAPGTYVLG